MITKFLTYIICAQLLLSTVSFQVSSIAYAAEDCAAGMEFSTSLNRCVQTQETVATKSEAQDCEALSEAEKQECFTANANAKLEGTPESAAPKSQMMLPLIATIGVGYSMMTKSALYSACTSTALKLMLGAGIASIGGEFMSQSKYKKELKSLEEKYKESQESEDYKDKEVTDNATVNQVKAFDYQIGQEKAKESAHKTRKTTYMLSSVLYFGATAMAVYEIVQSYGAGYTGCASGDVNNDQLRKINPLDILPTPNIESFMFYARVIYNNTLNFTPAANADFSLGAIFAKTLGVGESLGITARASLYGTAAISGLLGAYSMSVASKAGEEAEKAGKRAKALEKLKKDFLAQGGAGFALCTPDDRTSPGKAACYCYLEDGTKNPKRETSTICKAAFGSSEFASASDYNSNSTDYDSGVKGCTTTDGKVDMGCSCKKAVDSKGNNACIKVSGQLNLGPLGLNKDFKNAVGNASDFVNGNISSAGFDSGNLQKLAARIRKQTDDFIKKNPKAAKANKDILKLKDRIEKRAAAQVSSGLKSGALAGFGAGGFFGGATSGSTDTDDKKEDVAVTPLKGLDSNGITLPTAGAKSGVDTSFFDDGAGGVTIEDEAMGDIMAQEYKTNDINGNSHHDIFKIISNRYLTSGLPHLFNNKDPSIIDAPAESEISEK